MTVGVSKKNSDFKTEVTAILYLGAIFCWTVYCVFHNKGIFSLWAYGDAQMLNAGIHFARDGYFVNHFLPRINPGLPHSLVENNGSNGRYFHYPALHALVVGAIVRLVDLIRGHSITSLEEIKNFVQVTFAFISVFSFYLNFLWLKKFVSNILSVLGLVAITTSGFYTNFGISLCDQPLHYFFFSTNLILISKLLDQPKCHIFLNRRLNWIIYINLFFATRNSVETPIVIVTLNSAAIIINGNKFDTSYVKWILKFLVTPATFAILVQFVQSRLEYATFTDFYDHWREVSGKRFPLVEIGDLSLILQIFDRYPMPYLSLLLFCVITLLFIRQRSRITRASKTIAESIILAYILGLTTLIFVIPRQMFYMNHYTLYYFNFAIVVGTIILINYLQKLKYASALTVLCIEIISLSSSGHSALALREDPKFLEFKSVFELKSQRWWAGSNESWSSIPLLKPQFFDAVAEYTQSDDLIVLPDKFRGNTVGESNSVVEFYIQRHAITTLDNVQATCEDLIEKVPGVKRIHTFDETLTKLTSETC